MRKFEPLVSVVVITYNSAQYVLETLDSIKRQSYLNIELIITDDGSSDNTVELCDNWITEHKTRFSSSLVLKSKENKGIPANCNQGINKAKGVYIKLIAGDDILLDNCIEINLNEVVKSPEKKVLYSETLIFYDTNIHKTRLSSDDSKIDWDFLSDECTAAEQYKKLLKGTRGRELQPPTLFLQKDLYDRVNGFDERLKHIEDYPFWLKVTSLGEKCYFIKKPTVMYRIHANSTYRKGVIKNAIVHPNYIKDELLRKLYIYANVDTSTKMILRYKYYLGRIFNALKLNNTNPINYFLFNLFYRYTNPFYIYKRFQIKIR